MKTPIQVIVIDDHEIVRIGLRSLLDHESDINVIGTAATGERGVALIERLQPDVAIVDYNLPGMSGVEVCAEVTTRWPNVRVVILTTFLDDAVVRNSLDAGAKAYVYKDVEGLALKRALRKVAKGDEVLDAKVADRVTRWAHAESARSAPPLSGREVDVLRLVARGLTNREVAKELGVSINTAKTCLSRAMHKLGATTGRAQAAALAAKRGLL